MENNIKISIIIPVYNTAEYLRRCLDSCVFQTMREIEIITICDCSSDIRDKQIIQEYERNYANMVRGVFHKQNLGAGEARNSGIRAAKGEFLMFCDSDDFLELNACKTMYDTVCFNDADLVICDYFYLRDGIIGTRTVNACIESVSHNQRPFYLDKSTVWTVMLKKTLIEDNELFFSPCRFGEDSITALWYLAAKKITKVNIPLYYYVYRKSSLIGSMTEQASVDLADAYIYLLNYKYFAALENEIKRTVCYSIFRRFFGYWLERLYKEPQGNFQELFKRLIDIKNYCNDFYASANNVKFNWETRRIFAMLRFAESNLQTGNFNERFRNFYSVLDMRITAYAVQKLCENLKGKRIVLWVAGSYGRIHKECLKNIGIKFEMTDINAASLGYKCWDELKDITDIVLVSSNEFVKTVIKIVTSQNKTDGNMDNLPIEVLDLQTYLNENCNITPTLFLDCSIVKN